MPDAPYRRPAAGSWTSAETEEKRSRFIACAAQVTGEDATRDFLASVRASYPDADLVVLDAHADANSAVLKRRADNAVNTGELLFALMILGDERAVTRTVVAGDG